ncbi:MAG: hypothetical protein J1E59_01825 [Treponema sp.]|nr:hypothetical protein [Treponema sp.]
MQQKNSGAQSVLLMQKILLRMTLFSFLLLISQVLLYVAGNFQKFLDSTQAFILRNTIFTAVTLFFFSLASIVAVILDSVLSKFFSRKTVALLAFCVFCIALAAVSGTVARGILALSDAFSIN